MKKILGLLATTLILSFTTVPVFADETAAPKPTDYPEEVVVADVDEAIVEEAEPTMWPVYLSLGMLGAMVLVFVILNLTGRKK